MSETSKLPPDIDSDPRIAYSQVTGKWIFENDENGLEYEWDEENGLWNPVVEEQDIQTQQKAYQRDGEEVKDEKIDDKDKDSDSKKRKNDDDAYERTKKRSAPPSPKPPAPSRQSTAIYITGLPKDVTREELQRVFSRFGVIAEDLKTGEIKIKLYVADDNTPKGDATIIYFKPESVSLAIEMMDETELRYGQGIIRVQKADFSHKEKTIEPKSSDNDSEEKKQQLTWQEKQKRRKKLEKLNSRLSEWSDEEYEIPQKEDKTVILRHVFTLDELEEDVTAALEIKQDIREGCEDIGTVTSVMLYDLEPEGIVSVRFKNSADAQACVTKMSGRFFGGRRLVTSIEDESIIRKYRRKRRSDEDDEQEAEERLEHYGDWLEAENEKE